MNPGVSGRQAPTHLFGRVVVATVVVTSLSVLANVVSRGPNDNALSPLVASSMSVTSAPTTSIVESRPIPSSDSAFALRTEDMSEFQNMKKVAPKVVRDASGCYLPQNLVGTPSLAAPTDPPPPSTTPKLDQKPGTVELGKDCGPGSMLWRYRTGDVVSSSAAFKDDLLYIGSRDGSLYALNVKTGQKIWSTPSQHAVDVIPYVDKDLVFYGSSSSYMNAVKADTGELVWQYRADGVFQSSPLAVGDVLYCGGGSHSLRALDRNTGKLLWEYKLDMWVQSSAAYRNGVVYIGADDGYLHALDAKSGKLLWQFAAALANDHKVDPDAPVDTNITPDGPRSNILSTPRFYENIALITSVAGSVYGVNADTGELVWSFYGERNVTDATVDKGVAYFHSDASILRAMDARTGEFLWGARTGTSHNTWPGPYQVGSAAAVWEDTVLVGGNDGDLSAFDRLTGRTLWSFRTQGWIMSSPKVQDGVAYVGSNDGWVYAIKL